MGWPFIHWPSTSFIINVCWFCMVYVHKPVFNTKVRLSSQVSLETKIDSIEHYSLRTCASLLFLWKLTEWNPHVSSLQTSQLTDNRSVLSAVYSSSKPTKIENKLIISTVRFQSKAWRDATITGQGYGHCILECAWINFNRLSWIGKIYLQRLLYKVLEKRRGEVAGKWFTKAKLLKLCFELLPHPQYSQELQTRDLYLFVNLKRIVWKEN